MPAELGHELIIAEPTASYARRSPLVVDCSVIAAIVFNEVRFAAALDLLDDKELFAPDLIDHEISNVAVNKSRQGSRSTAQFGLLQFSQLAITRCRTDPAAQTTLALEFGLSAYDAAYLLLALDFRAPLATFDRRLGEAAQRAFS